MRKRLLQEMQHRYFNHRPPKYGNLNKTFDNEQQVVIFLEQIPNLRVRTAFQLCYYLGLRIGEACKQLIEDIDFLQRRLWVRSAKGSVPTSMYLHEKIYRLLVAYYEAHAEEITRTGYLFPSHAAMNHTASRFPYMSPDYCRKYFRATAQKLSLEITYAESEETDEERPVRHLHKLSTHSFRRRFIQDVHEQTGDIYVTKKLARHRKISSTEIYLHANQEQTDNILVATFKSSTGNN